jgi:histidine ammonia-lyase
MGWSGARKLRRSVDALGRVLAIEVLTAARGIQLRSPLEPSPATGAVITALGARANAAPGQDRFLAPDIEGAHRAVTDGDVLAAAESVTGPLR